MYTSKKTGPQIMACAIAVVLSVCAGILAASRDALAEDSTSFDTGNTVRVVSNGVNNWDVVTNVAQFKGYDSDMCFAIDSGDTVEVHKVNDGLVVPGVTNLKKQHPLFGTALCDAEGNYYVVTGENNETDDRSRETVFVTKYDREGNVVKTVGDDGTSSLADYYDGGFNTKKPFDGGNCDAAIFGDVLTVDYARGMYSGHQSNSVLSVNMRSMEKVKLGTFYQSHSFAQRVVATTDGFVHMSEGDCYDRAFVACHVSLSDGAHEDNTSGSVFDFWVQDGALDAYDMGVINQNFAHMGGLAALKDGRVAFAAQSARSLNSNAKTEAEDIFIQIFDPSRDLSSSSAYTTTGDRTGLAGNNGRTETINHGVAWLTSFGEGSEASNVQIAVTDSDAIVILYEYRESGAYQGVYYIVLDKNGQVTCPATLFGQDAKLNPCEMPVFADGSVCWIGNKEGFGDQLYVYVLNPPSSSVALSPATIRLAGATRYSTMKAVVEAGFAQSEWAVVATGQNFPDALAASALAGVRRCPVILTDSSNLSNEARTELQRLGVKNAYLMGGSSAIATAVEGQIAELGIQTDRVGGADRVATSLESLRRVRDVGSGSDTVIVTTGYGYADALSVGPLSYAKAAPIVLTNGDGVLSEEALSAIIDDGRFSRAVIVGGTSVVSAATGQSLSEAGLEVIRLAGANRYETSAQVASWSTENGLSWSSPAVATGKNFPDALAGAALEGTKASPLLLVDTESDASLGTLRSMAPKVSSAYVLGGVSAVSNSVAKAVDDVVVTTEG